MRKILFGLLASLFISPAYADFTAKDASAATITFKNPSGACTSVVCVPVAAIVDSTGANVVAVKAASTAAAATDISLVTNESPNSQLSVTLGTTADSVCGSATGTCSLAALVKFLNNAATAATPAGTNLVGYTSADPCTQKTKTNLAISQNGTSSVQLVALSGSTTIYVCSLSLIAAGATTVALTTGTGAACVTGNAAVIGSTTANIANSMSLAANGGLTLGSGAGTVAAGAASGELCMILGTSVYVSGNLTYVQQ